MADPPWATVDEAAHRVVVTCASLVVGMPVAMMPYNVEPEVSVHVQRW